MKVSESVCSNDSSFGEKGTSSSSPNVTLSTSSILKVGRLICGWVFIFDLV